MQIQIPTFQFPRTNSPHFDNAADSGYQTTSPYTFNVLVGSGTNRLLTIGCSIFQSGSVSSISTQAVASYQFNDRYPTDTNSVWTDDAKAFAIDNGLGGGNAAITGTQGSTGSNYLQGVGTNAPADGGTITQVRARIFGLGTQVPGALPLYGAIYTSGLGELLETCVVTSDAPATWGAYKTLNAPGAGWSWSVLQGLTVKIYGTGGFIMRIFNAYRVEIEVTTSSKNATSIRADSNSDYRSELWQVIPDVGTNTITVTLSGNIASISNAESHWGVDQTSPIDANDGANGTGNPALASVTTITNKDRVVGNLSTKTASGITSQAGQSPRTTKSGALGTGASDDKGIVDVAAATSLQWNGITAGHNWAISLAALKPVGAGGGATVIQQILTLLGIGG